MSFVGQLVLKIAIIAREVDNRHIPAYAQEAP
jgi:hypothetical protein